jgi:pimeloyl-ACP methyl ester carboxylesterase
MKVIVFVPGTMATELRAADGELLWPPKLLETQFGYRRIDKLVGEGVVADQIIRKVACVDFYAPLFDQFEALGFRPGDPAQRLYTLPYDWRLDLEQTAQALAALLDTAQRDGASEIHLVAHSMGGLISRLAIESQAYAARPWRALLRSFIALAVPHKGAPLALARVLGLDSALGISKTDFKRLTSDRRYPSAYQLLPAPGEEACWNQSDAALAEVDLYDEADAAKLGLDPALLARARFVHSTLDDGAPPAQVRYFYFAGTGHETITRVNVERDASGHFPVDRMTPTRTPNAGDGTVPFWSALPRKGQKQVVVNEHASVFTGMAFKSVFYRLLGGHLGNALQSIEQGLVADPDALRLSMPTPVIERGQAFELLLVPQVAVGQIDGELVLRRLNDDGQAGASPPEALAEVSYQGAPVSTLRLTMPALANRGLYQLRFEGQPVTTRPLRFAVVDFAAPQH